MRRKPDFSIMGPFQNKKNITIFAVATNMPWIWNLANRLFSIGTGFTRYPWKGMYLCVSTFWTHTNELFKAHPNPSFLFLHSFSLFPILRLSFYLILLKAMLRFFSLWTNSIWSRRDNDDIVKKVILLHTWDWNLKLKKVPKYTWVSLCVPHLTWLSMQPSHPIGFGLEVGSSKSLCHHHPRHHCQHRRQQHHET